MNSILVTVYFTGTDRENALLGFLWDDLQSAAEYISDNGNDDTHNVYSAQVEVVATDLSIVEY